jgi:hypothetical protein
MITKLMQSRRIFVARGVLAERSIDGSRLSPTSRSATRTSSAAISGPGAAVRPTVTRDSYPVVEIAAELFLSTSEPSRRFD